MFVYIILILLNYYIFEHNDTIHATIWKGLLSTYRPPINEGSIYVFSNFKVEGSIRYRALRNEKKIVFTYNTKVKEVNEPSDKYKQQYFDDEAYRPLKINVTALLESLNGRTEEIPKNIQNHYEESFIFQFKRNNQNFTEGSQVI